MFFLSFMLVRNAFFSCILSQINSLIEGDRQGHIFNVLMAAVCAGWSFPVFCTKFQMAKPSFFIDIPHEHVVLRSILFKVLPKTKNMKDVRIFMNSCLGNQNRISKVLKQDVILNLEGV